jgi:hypothetical protein
MKLPQRSERIVKIPIKQNSPRVGIKRKQEIQESVFLAEALRIKDDLVLTSVLHANETEVETNEQLMELEEIDVTQETI